MADAERFGAPDVAGQRVADHQGFGGGDAEGFQGVVEEERVRLDDADRARVRHGVEEVAEPLALEHIGHVAVEIGDDGEPVVFLEPLQKRPVARQISPAVRGEAAGDGLREVRPARGQALQHPGRLQRHGLFQVQPGEPVPFGQRVVREVEGFKEDVEALDHPGVSIEREEPLRPSQPVRVEGAAEIEKDSPEPVHWGKRILLHLC